jgi:hypothetical protein
MTISQIGGARVGVFMNATWPLAKLVANSDELTLRVVVLKYSFPKASIVRISEHTGPLAGVLPRFITSGLRIEHRNKNVPDFVVFWTSHSSDLLKQLASMGYQTS